MMGQRYQLIDFLQLHSTSAFCHSQIKWADWKMLDTNMKHHTNVWICLSQKTSAPETKLLELRFAWVMLSQNCKIGKKDALHPSCTLADHKSSGRGPLSKAKMVSLCMRSVFLTSVSYTLEIGNVKRASDIMWLIFVFCCQGWMVVPGLSSPRRKERLEFPNSKSNSGNPCHQACIRDLRDR